ncbi:carbohydrate kinase family protein [Candidatus Woesearchaeota archaeon]|nr:carbohydrate kinase family protein [Candidatus Woesearchaeota archaeon]
MYDIITVGSATVDVFAKTTCEHISIKNGSEENNLIAYPTGSKILIEELDFMIGGGGTNTAVSFSRLGLKTAFLGKIGFDSNSQEILSLLVKEHVDFIGPRSKAQSGYSIILDSIEEDRTILTYKGVNDCLDLSEIDKSSLKSKWFYFSSMMGRSFLTLEKLSSYARRKGIKVAFNPSSYLAQQGVKKLGRILKATDFLVLNLEEARLIIGNRDISSLLFGLEKLGPKIIAITDGKNGVYVKHKSNLYHQPANRVRIHETTGAGDAYASGFVSGLIIKGDVLYAMDIGMANATSVIKHLGAKNRLLTLAQAEKEMLKNKPIEKLLIP